MTRRVGPTTTLILVVFVLAAPVVAAHGPPIQAEPEAHDQLGGHDRSWRTEMAGGNGSVVDLEGEAAFPLAPGVAFRVHTDVAFIEGVFTVMRGDPPRPDALFNTGMRLQAVDLEPPLELAGGGTLARVFLGPLDFSAPNITTLESGGATVTRITTGANITVPDANGTSPAEHEVASTGIVLHWAIDVTDRMYDHPDFVVHGPASARMRLELVVPHHALAGGRAPEDQVARLATVFDYGGSAQGRTVAPGDPADAIDAYGIFLERQGRWAYVRGAPHAYPVGLEPATAHEDTDGLQTGTATFGAPSYNRAPNTTMTSLLSPLGFNLTLPLVASPEADPDPSGSGRGVGVGWELELGYQLDERRPIAGDGDGAGADGDGTETETGGGDETTPGPSGPATLLAVVGALMVARGRDRLRRLRSPR